MRYYADIYIKFYAVIVIEADTAVFGPYIEKIFRNWIEWETAKDTVMM